MEVVEGGLSVITLEGAVVLEEAGNEGRLVNSGNFDDVVKEEEEVVVLVFPTSPLCCSLAPKVPNADENSGLSFNDSCVRQCFTNMFVP